MPDHSRTILLLPGLLTFLMVMAVPGHARVPPAEDGEPIGLRRIADADGRPVDDSPPVRRVGVSGSKDEFDPIEVRRIDLQAVEPSIGDRGPLDLSLRWIDPGLRLPFGYDQVYMGRDGGFWRADGGLVARFEQSTYLPSRYGMIPDIPASTVFVIGGVPLGGEPGHGRLLAIDPLDPAGVPSLTGLVAVPDEWHSPSAVPGDRFARFGFGPGYRVPFRVDVDAAPVPQGSARFQSDPDYRAARITRMLACWHDARPDDPVEHVKELSPRSSDSEEARPSPEDVTANPDPGS